MSVTEKLASSLQHRDEAPNLELAEKIASQKDRQAVEELIGNLNNTSKDIQNDCIKVLYEIGNIDSDLIAKYAKEFIGLLVSKNNRLQWGAMMAIDSISLHKPEYVYASIPKILAAADKGSVITKDYAVSILVKLCSVKQYADPAFALLNEQLLKSPANQLPMYAEKAMVIINAKNKKDFVQTLSLRLEDIDKEPKRKRVEKVIKKVSGK